MCKLSHTWYDIGNTVKKHYGVSKINCQKIVQNHKR